jgi:hypothetical protein
MTAEGSPRNMKRSFKGLLTSLLTIPLKQTQIQGSVMDFELPSRLWQSTASPKNITFQAILGDALSDFKELYAIVSNFKQF